jgi:hypothetical protein
LTKQEFDEAVERLLERRTMTGEEVERLVMEPGVKALR